MFLKIVEYKLVLICVDKSFLHFLR